MTICIQKRNVSGSKCNSQKNDKYCNVLQNKKITLMYTLIHG